MSAAGIKWSVEVRVRSAAEGGVYMSGHFFYFKGAINGGCRPAKLGRKDLSKGVAGLQHCWIFQSWRNAFLEVVFQRQMQAIGLSAKISKNL